MHLLGAAVAVVFNSLHDRSMNAIALLLCVGLL
jgi:hypothetical protein